MRATVLSVALSTYTMGTTTPYFTSARPIAAVESRTGAARSSWSIVYERYFGITGSPFQLSPDPAFFFEGDQHRAALKAMREALSQSLPFFVLSGEVGAGKTTLVQTLIDETRSAGFAVAHVTNTQLSPNELIGSICSSFGIPNAFGPEVEPFDRLKPFLAELGDRVALIVVDEAQNLGCDALQCLVNLSAVGRFHFYLVGQPALEILLRDASLGELRPLIHHSIHLGPLGARQTQRYIEHRLQRVGWAGVPSFGPGAFNEIHRLTGGLPRRINVLCNRLMLSKFLSRTTAIDVSAVLDAANELEMEIGDGILPSTIAVRRPLREAEHIETGMILIVSCGSSDHVKSVPLLLALGRCAEIPPALVVSMADDNQWDLDRHWHDSVGLANPRIRVSDDVSRLGSAKLAFQIVLDRYRPVAVIVFDGSSIARDCAQTADEHAIALVHVGSDAQGRMEQDGVLSARYVIRQLAGLRFDCQSPIAAAESVDTFEHAFVGNLLVDAVHLAADAATSRIESDQRTPARMQLDRYQGYGVVALREHDDLAMHDALPILREVSRDLPLVWPSQRVLESRMSGPAWELAGQDIACIEPVGHIAFVRLLRSATCVLTDSYDVQETAAALGVPCLLLLDDQSCHVGTGGWLSGFSVGRSPTKATWALWQVMFNMRPLVQLPPLWDGEAAGRIAAHLSAWLAIRKSTATASSLGKPTSLMRFRVRLP